MTGQQTERVPTALQGQYDAITALTDQFCEVHLKTEGTSLSGAGLDGAVRALGCHPRPARADSADGEDPARKLHRALRRSLRVGEGIQRQDGASAAQPIGRGIMTLPKIGARSSRQGLVDRDRCHDCGNACARAESLLNHLDQANLSKAFRGELVPQDPDDEPASVLLERICAARAEQPKNTRKGRGQSANARVAA